MRVFERCALAVVGLLVSALVWVTTAHPPPSVVPASYRQAIPPAPAPLVVEDILPQGADGMVRDAALAAAVKLADPLNGLAYDLDSVLSGKGGVPRVFLASLPAGMADVREVETRKAMFFKAVLPLVLQVNEEILADRGRLWNLIFDTRLGLRLDALDRLWLAGREHRYGVARNDLEGLLERMDIIPPSLALAQAAEESGWGTSRFAREGNALFGQWTLSGAGSLIPKRRDEGKDHGIRAFDSLLDAVRAYARNLNTHRAYGKFRQARAQSRRDGAPLDGAALAANLTSYSQRGKGYVASVRVIIKVNGLRALDDARLVGTDTVLAPAI